MKFLSKIVFLGLVTLLPTSPLLGQEKVTKAQLREVSAELAALDKADQEDQNLWGQVEESVLDERLQVRLKRVREIVTQSLLGEAVDYHHAAWLLQHGNDQDDYLMAHILAAVASFEQYEPAYFMSAAALDRFMMCVGQTQRFGSQTFDEKGLDHGDTSGFLSDSIVSLYRGSGKGLIGNPVAKEARSKKKLKASSKFLKKAAKKSPKLSGTTDAKEVTEWEAMLKETKGIVAAGSLADAQAHYDASLVLSYGKDKDTLLLAHILAMNAGLLEHKKARALFLRTLDLYMIALNRAPIFNGDAEKGVEKPILPEILVLHPRIRARILGNKR